MAKFKLFLGISFFIILISSVILIEAAPKASLITSLPGFNGTFPSKHYSGYVSFDQKNLFYYFVVSERNPVKDPVVLWLNGGPGCSSLDGFVYEHGPFNFQETHPKGSLPVLHLNPYSWSKVSNIIYLDSPCGVGYSYSENATKYQTGDLQTASDTHDFLLEWFKIYPEFVHNPFYISGESYAGIYVPTLASNIIKGLQAGVQPKINFKGYTVGNGVADDYFDSTLVSLVPFAHGMGLISDDIYQEIRVGCSGNKIQSCMASVKKAAKSIGDINFYNILEPCYHNPEEESNTKLPKSFKELGKTERPLKVRKRMFGRAWPLWGQMNNGTLWPQLAQHGSVMCFNDEVATAWLNNADVRKAIHAKPESIAGKWDLCTDRINYSRYDVGSMLPYHKNLTLQGYRVLIYSGDHDMCVPFTGTQAWTRSLGYKIVEEWRPWLSNNQVAGYLQQYAHNLTFLTIKGAGHTVPEYKPRESLDFYSRWLDEKSI